MLLPPARARARRDLDVFGPARIRSHPRASPLHPHRPAPLAIERHPDGLARAIVRRRHDLQRVELAARKIPPAVGDELEDVTARRGARDWRRTSGHRRRCHDGGRRRLRDAIDVALRIEADAFVRLRTQRRARHFVACNGSTSYSRPACACGTRGSGVDGWRSGRISSAISSVCHGVQTMPSMRFQ